VPTDFVSGQIRSVLSDIGADAVKIGMLHSAELIRAVRTTLAEFPSVRNIVLDPVMVATSGDKLLLDEAIETLQTELIPYVRVITPNIPEAEILLGASISSQSELPQVIRSLSADGRVSVLLKAGHLHDEALTDVFYNAETDEITELPSQRIHTRNTHGTGCTLSSAIAAFLAHGLELTDAVRRAKDYVNAAIIAGADYEIGKGHGPVHHFWRFW
jgi:hydroxymethylpyrimidine/phosphomethylpyrimidine kinase